MIPVLHVSAAGVYGGNEEHLRTLFAHVDRDRFEMHLAAPEGSSLLRRSAAMGVRCHPLSIRSGTDPGALFRMLRVLQDSGCRILHTHNRWEDRLGALSEPFRPGIPWITTLHDRINMDQEGRRTSGPGSLAYGLLLRRADLLLANSRETARDSVACAGLAPARVVPITNGQDLSRLEGVVPDPSPLPPAACRVGLVARVRGRAVQKKGLPEFLKAAAGVLRAGADASFSLIGADADAARFLSEEAAREGIPAPRWTAVPFREDPRPVMAALDVLVCPSRFEGLPRALLEGMGLGRAAVATAVDGSAEVVEDGVSGLLVPREDPEALARAVLRLCADPALRARLGAAAALRVRGRYGAARMAREHEAAWLAIIPAP